MTSPERSTTTGTIRDTLRGCRDAEQYFALLDVDFDQRVLDVNRLHILRAFANELDTLDDFSADDVARVACRQALERAYGRFTSSTALDHRLFKVLRERAPRAFVSLDQVDLDQVDLDQVDLDQSSLETGSVR